MEELIHAFGIDWRLLIVQSVNFGVLLAVLTFFLYKPILRVLKERQELAEKGVRDAKEAEARLSQIGEERVKTLAAADEEARGIVARGKELGEQKRAEMLAQASAQADAALADARAQAEEAKRAALKAAEADIAKLAILGAEKILRNQRT
jgi:F-type H+-transporting ATPase subunit b